MRRLRAQAARAHGRTSFASLTVDRISTLRASSARAWQDKFRKILSTSSAARTLPTCCAHAAGMLCACCAQLRTRMAGQVSLASVDRLCSAHAVDMLCARCAQAAGMLRAAHGRTSSEKFCRHFYAVVGFRFASLCRHSSLPFVLNFSNLVKPHYSNVEKFCRHFYAMIGFRFASLCRNASHGEARPRHAKAKATHGLNGLVKATSWARHAKARRGKPSLASPTLTFSECIG